MYAEKEIHRQAWDHAEETSPARDPQVGRAYNSLEKAQAQQQEIIENLERRLEAVLRQVGPDKSGENAGVHEIQVPLAIALLGASDRTIRANARLQSILDRLEV